METGSREQATDCLFLRDAYVRECEAEVVEVSRDDIRLDATVFYPTGGGQPHDTGWLGGGRVKNVRWGPRGVWHTVEGRSFTLGERLIGQLDWDRRHQLMRTHTALHVLSGVIWNEWGVSVTGGTMEPLSARMDFEFDPLPSNFKEYVEELVNKELQASRPVHVMFLDRPAALADPALIRTKVNLIPQSVTQIRVVDIEGLDKQADGGLHVRNTDEVGSVRIVKTESKGKQNKRVRIAILDDNGEANVPSARTEPDRTGAAGSSSHEAERPSPAGHRENRPAHSPVSGGSPRALLCPDRW